jgi:hypothetical protein
VWLHLASAASLAGSPTSFRRGERRWATTAELEPRPQWRAADVADAADEFGRTLLDLTVGGGATRDGGSRGVACGGSRSGGVAM